MSEVLGLKVMPSSPAYQASYRQRAHATTELYPGSFYLPISTSPPKSLCVYSLQVPLTSPLHPIPFASLRLLGLDVQPFSTPNLFIPQCPALMLSCRSHSHLISIQVQPHCLEGFHWYQHLSASCLVHRLCL